MADLWIEKVTLGLLLLTTAFTLYALKGGTECWTPTHFGGTHARYANNICSTNGSRRYAMPNIEEAIPKEPSKNGSEILLTPITYDDNSLLKLLIGEILFVCIMYHVAKLFISSTNLDVFSPRDSHKFYFKVPAYVLVQIASAVIWMVLAILSNNILTESNHSSGFVFLCDFDVRRLGNIQRYTVQCIDHGTDGLHVAITMNMGLCLVVCVAKLTHIVAAFFIQPCGKINSIAEKLMDLNVIKSSNEVGFGFAFSDLYFAIMVHGDGILKSFKQD